MHACMHTYYSSACNGVNFSVILYCLVIYIKKLLKANKNLILPHGSGLCHVQETTTASQAYTFRGNRGFLPVCPAGEETNKHEITITKNACNSNFPQKCH